MPKDGVLGIEYHYRRQSRRSHTYRLWRRGAELARVIQVYCPAAHRLLDIGTADGLVIPVIQREIPALRVTGLDRSLELLQAGNRAFFSPLLADATQLPFSTASFDVVSAAAVIEHLHHPMDMLRGCYRVLRPGGICIITTPDPFFERLATSLGILNGEQHPQVFDLVYLKTMFERAGFEVLEAEKFMLSPVGFPLERRIEQVCKKIGLGSMLLNQIVAGQR
jgi:ubiquinone/menaquinone biosynthesis C-methylase UbiE